MLPVIVAFDPELPIVASKEITVGGRVYAADAPFPWRDAGLDERELRDFYRAWLVRCERAPEPTASEPTPSPAPTKRKR